jgi:hypothetical protein
MRKLSVPTLLYATTSARRWVEAAITTPDADLRDLCAWQWRRATKMMAIRNGLLSTRAPIYVQLLKPESAGRSTGAQLASPNGRTLCSQIKEEL